MRSHRVAALALAGALLAATPVAALEPPQTFEIVNDTGQTAERLYLQSPGAGDWQEDLLGENVLPAGSWAEAPLDPAHGCHYDLKVVLADGAMVTAYDFDVCVQPRFKMSGGQLTRPRAGNTAPSEPGMAPGGYAIQATTDETGEPAPSMEVGAAPIGRGLPVCPGDPRCKKK